MTTCTDFVTRRVNINGLSGTYLDRAPEVTDDSDSGWGLMSTWIHDGSIYFCVDPTPGAAVWSKVGNAAAHATSHESGGSDAINHDSLTGFVAAEHVDHTAVTLTAGTGLGGGGTIAASRTFDLADTAVTPGAYTLAGITVDQQGRITAAATGTIPITNDGADRIVTANGDGTLTAESDLTFDGTSLAGPVGDVTNPTFELGSGSSTGFYRESTNRVAVASGGVQVGKFLQTGFEMGSVRSFTFNNYGGLSAKADGLFVFANNSGGGLTRFCIGRNLSTYPAFEINGSDLQVIRGDGSTDCSLYITKNLMVGGAVEPTGTIAAVAAFADNTGDPTPGSNTCGLYGKDVSGTVEQFAIDEAANATQLTSHPTDAPAEMLAGFDYVPLITKTQRHELGQIHWVHGEKSVGGKPWLIRESFDDYNARMGLGRKAKLRKQKRLRRKRRELIYG